MGVKTSKEAPSLSCGSSSKPSPGRLGHPFAKLREFQQTVPRTVPLELVGADGLEPPTLSV